MIEFLIDNIFVESGGVIFQQVIGIPMGTNCAPLLADLFLYSYASEAEFIQTLIKSGIVNCPFLNSNITQSPAYIFFHNLHVTLALDQKYI